MNSTNTLAKKKLGVKIVVIWVSLVVLVRLIIYVTLGIFGFGRLGLPNLISAVINIVMYISILKYAIDYFLRDKDASLQSLIFRYGIATLATLIGLRSGNETIFVLTAIMVFIVPYVSASITQRKKSTVALIIVVLALSIAVAALYMIYPAESELATIWPLYYTLNVLNPVIEWLIFTVLFFTRGILEMGVANEAESERIEETQGERT